MKPASKLIVVKVIHTFIWLCFNVVIFYLLYAVLAGKIDKWMWMGFGCFFIEGIVLLIFKNYCPLTLIAKRYSDSSKDNFDIYLPNWLAKYNKVIYTFILAVIILILIFRLVQA
jgi:hypothetical protein